MSKVHIYANGITHCSVCVPKEMAGDEIARAVNNESPTGISSAWTISDDATFATGHSNPCECEADSERLHYLMVIKETRLTDIENPAGKVAGYTPQPDAKAALVNEFKADEERLLRKLDDITVQRTFRANSNGESSVTDSEPEVHVDQRWLAIARTDFQRAYMALNRAVFQPQRIKLPEDGE